MIQETCVHFLLFTFPAARFLRERAQLYIRQCISSISTHVYNMNLFTRCLLSVRVRLMSVFLKTNATWFNAWGHDLCVSILASFSDLLPHFSHETIMLHAQPETCFLVHACALTHPTQMKPYLLFDMPHRRALHLSGDFYVRQSFIDQEIKYI